MRKTTTYLISLLLCLLVGASCIDRPDYVLDEEQMIDVLVDVHKAEGLIEMQSSSHYTQDMQKSIMAAVMVKHGVSRAQYDSSLMWYARHLKLLVRVYSHVDERLLDEHERWSALTTDAKDFATSESGDSVQLWSMRNYLILDRSRFADQRFWELESDSNFLEGDTLRWTFDVDHLIEGQKLFASISFVAPEKETKGVSISQKNGNQKCVPIGQGVKLIQRNGSHTISAVPDSLQHFDKAYLSLLLVSPDSTRLQSPVFLNRISLIRYHRE